MYFIVLLSLLFVLEMRKMLKSLLILSVVVHYELNT